MLEALYLPGEAIIPCRVSTLLEPVFCIGSHSDSCALLLVSELYLLNHLFIMQPSVRGWSLCLRGVGGTPREIPWG